MAFKILRLKEVIRKTGLSQSTIYRYLQLGIFPAQIQIGLRSVGWRDCDIDQWIEDRASAKPFQNVYQGSEDINEGAEVEHAG